MQNVSLIVHKERSASRKKIIKDTSLRRTFAFIMHIFSSFFSNKYLQSVVIVFKYFFLFFYCYKIYNIYSYFIFIVILDVLSSIYSRLSGEVLKIIQFICVRHKSPILIHFRILEYLLQRILLYFLVHNKEYSGFIFETRFLM